MRKVQSPKSKVQSQRTAALRAAARPGNWLHLRISAAGTSRPSQRDCVSKPRVQMRKVQSPKSKVQSQRTAALRAAARPTSQGLLRTPVARMPPPSQRDCVSKPRVARNELPWESRTMNTTLKGLRLHGTETTD